MKAPSVLFWKEFERIMVFPRVLILNVFERIVGTPSVLFLKELEGRSLDFVFEKKTETR